ncbi:MAG: metallophosphoesterase family protein [Candidatus Omnitrophica bacterium]|nr:metallophosphoesterase family protein [Candidatus Omnitrophota bacterium]HOX54504.1 metallophosphoesterase family protein [Candidatus Omnitrophota bacterium]
MRYGIFSDIHSNLEAFQAVIEAYKKENIDRYLCVGDIVGYGVDPGGCIDKIKQLDALTIAGNHDWAAVELTDITYFNQVAKQAIVWTRDKISKEDKELLRSLKLVHEVTDFVLVHGTLNKPEEFNYLLDVELAMIDFGLMKKTISFVGHSHVAGIFIQEKGEISYSVQAQIKIDPKKKYIVNVGSVGQPRDRDNRASYCIFDADKKEVAIKRTEYDIARTQEKIIRAGMPPFLAARLSSGM